MKFSLILKSILFGLPLAITPLGAQIIISEFMADNDTFLADDDGAYNDWIEIRNPGVVTISLGGYHLTDEAANPTKWTFPSLPLGPGARLVVFASNKNRTDPAATLHTNFKLSASGEYLALVAPDGTTIASEYAPTYPPQFPNESFGLGAPGSSTRVNITPPWSSPGNYNTVRINGVKSATVGGTTDNRDDLFNGSQLHY